MDYIFSGKAHVSQTDVVPPSIPQIFLLFIVIGVLGSGDSLWVIRLAGTCSRLVCNLLFAIAVKVLLQSNIKYFEGKKKQTKTFLKDK